MTTSYQNYSISDSIKDNIKKLLNKVGKNYDTHEVNLLNPSMLKPNKQYLHWLK